MDIAPGFPASTWQEFDLDPVHGRDWARAVGIFRSRIEERFLFPAEILIASETQRAAVSKRLGFAVLALDCVLVETLGAFLLGLKDTRRKSGPTFRTFLRIRPRLAKWFRTDAIADAFYQDFRCGILHQAEVGRDSRVWAVGPLLRIEATGLVVNRNAFHDCLRQEFESYLEELKAGDHLALRRNFAKKMRFVSHSPRVAQGQTADARRSSAHVE